MAALYEAEGDDDDASATLLDLTNASLDVTAAEALWRRGNLEAARGNEAEAQSMYRTLVRTYTASSRALDALNTTQVATDPFITTFDSAYVYFVQRINELARNGFQQIVDSAPGTTAAAWPHYYLGILSERFSLYGDALVHYDAAIALVPPGVDNALRGQAMWDRATVLELQGDIDGAIAGFAAVGEVPGAALAGEGTFRAGLLAYNLGRSDAAITHWTRFSEVAAGAHERVRAHYWLGLAHSGLDNARAGEEFAAASAADPIGYYGLVASGRVDPAFCCLDGDPPGDDAHIVSWLTVIIGPEFEAGRAVLFESAAWGRAVELHEAGLSQRADAEFQELLEDVTGDSWLLYRFAEETSALGLPWISTLAAQQESLYFPRAVSSADALGLTQVIPTTADGIAVALEEPDFTYLDLFRPNVSIRFGAYYVGTQLADFGGNVRAAVAAYNGGPFNAETWLAAAGGDNDVFVETITFAETRSYVELVLENYALYRYAWGQTSRPALLP